MYCGSNEPERLWRSNSHIRDSCACIARSFAGEVGSVRYERAVVRAAVWWWRAKDHMSVTCSGEEGDSRERENGHN